MSIPEQFLTFSSYLISHNPSIFLTHFSELFLSSATELQQLHQHINCKTHWVSNCTETACARAFGNVCWAVWNVPFEITFYFEKSNFSWSWSAVTAAFLASAAWQEWDRKKNVHSVHQGLWGGITFCIVIFIVAPAAGNASLQHMKMNLLEVIMYCNWRWWKAIQACSSTLTSASEAYFSSDFLNIVPNHNNGHLGGFILFSKCLSIWQKRTQTIPYEDLATLGRQLNTNLLQSCEYSQTKHRTKKRD